MHVITKKQVFIAVFLAVFSIILSLGIPLSISTLLTRPQYMVVIDAGHGGIDGGVSGKTTKVKESDLNLLVAQKLSKYFKSSAIGTVMTRKDKRGLYKLTDKGSLKRSDMQKRAQIIKETNADFVISIHMNYFPSSARRGAQVFFDSGNEHSRYLATCIQDELNENINKKHSKRSYMPLSAELFLLQCSQTPTVIVECGFLSNPLDEQLLLQESFQFEIAYYIFSGAMTYLMTKDEFVNEENHL